MGKPALTRECAMLHRYLVGGAPSAYAAGKYVAAHDQLPALREAAGWFDRLLLGAALVHPLFMRLVQVYARIFAPTALVRKKAVLLLAIIECCAPSLTSIQAPRTRAPLIAIAASTVIVAGFALELLFAALVFGPVHLASLVGRLGRGEVRAQARALGKVA
jgi:hypothetical protein